MLKPLEGFLLNADSAPPFPTHGHTPLIDPKGFPIDSLQAIPGNSLRLIYLPKRERRTNTGPREEGTNRPAASGRNQPTWARMHSNVPRR